MPGLMRAVGRTAVIAGTATAVSNRVSRRQAGRWAAQEQQGMDQQAAYQQQMPAPMPQEPQPDKVTMLKELASLKEQGILTEAEFSTQKQKILAS
jgi:Short C-terminal domain